MMNFKQILFDKQIYEINLLPQRSTFAVYGSEERYRAGKEEGTLLDNGWKGLYAEDVTEAMEEYLSREKSLDGIKDIEVPLAIELQGYGQLRYVNTQYPFDGYNEGAQGEEIRMKNPCMLYLRDYSLAEKKADRKYVLNFKGSESALFLYVNAQPVGYSENLYLDSEFDITKYLAEGENRIAVFCFQFCSSTWLLDQDFYRFSGLFREVVLSELSSVGVYDIDIHSRVDSQSRTSETTIIVAGGEEDTCRVLSVFDEAGRTVWQAEGTGGQERFSFRLTDIRLWNAEEPYLYRLTVRTYRDGALLEIAETPFGFREVCIKDGLLLLNGKRLILNGINRHEWSMERGRSLTREDMDFDVSFLKEHNINAVRTSHYPNHTYFYELSDRCGFYLMDEACLESHGSFGTAEGSRCELSLPADNPEWETICLNKLLRMYERDKNHPSIILWSLGNESGCGETFFRMREALKIRNPDVLIHYEQGYEDETYMKVSDVYSSMYMPATKVSGFIENSHTDKPYILCEYAHAMGNSLGDLDSYRTLLMKYPTFQGGFVWDYIDQGLMTEHYSGRRMLCYGGDFLEKPNDHDFCCNGILLADRKRAYQSSKANTLKYYYQPIAFELREDSVLIRNRYLFRDTSHLAFVLEVLADGRVVSVKRFEASVRAGGCAEQKIDGQGAAGGAEILYRVRAVLRRRDGRLKKDAVIACEEKVIHRGKQEHFDAPDALKVIDGHYNIGVTAGNASYLFSKAGTSFTVAGLMSICVAGEEFLVNEARPTVFRPNTSNDIGNCFCFDSALALSFSKYIRCDVDALRYGMRDNCFTISYRYRMDHETGEGADVTYQIDGAGRMRVTAALDKMTHLKSLPLFGIHFELAETKERFSYYGKGPFDSYPDRKKGTLSGIYESTCGGEFVPYIYPQECGNHEDTRWLLIQGEKSGLRFEGDGQTFRFKYLKYSDFEIENAAHPEELPWSGRNHLTICGFMRGVGGDDSWLSPVHEPFELKSDGGYHFSFTVRPVISQGGLQDSGSPNLVQNAGGQQGKDEGERLWLE